MSSESKYCILKTRVSRSQSTPNTAYHVWAVIEKDGERPGGKIYSAYCTCTAGLLRCCNHVTVMLFRVEAAVPSGATKPFSTSMLACWNVRTGCKTTLVHKPLADMTFHKHHSKKRKTNAQNIACNNDCCKSFNVTGEYETFLQDPKEHRLFLYSMLKDDTSGSCFIELMEGTKNNKPRCTKTALPDNMPGSVVGLARLFQIDETCTQVENIIKFTNSLNLSVFQIKLIEEATRSQSSSDEWFKQREGRITASNIPRVYTRMETLKKQNK